jgi:hypothetical protein
MDEVVARNAAEEVDRMAGRVGAAAIAGAVGARSSHRCRQLACADSQGMTMSDRPLRFVLGFCFASLMAIAACSGSPTEVSTASTPKPPDFQVVSLDWRSERVEVPCNYPGCISGLHYNQTLHGIFKNVGGRGSAIATFTGVGDGQPSEECSVPIPDTATNGITEAACLIGSGRYSTGKVRVSYGR